MPPVAVAVAASPPAASPSSPPPRARSTLDGPQKAAALILGLDEEAATELLRHLSPAELRQLGPAVDALRLDDMSELEGVFNEFAEAMERPALPRSGGAYLRRLASAAFGAEHAARVLAPDDARTSATSTDLWTNRVTTVPSSTY